MHYKPLLRKSQKELVALNLIDLKGMKFGKLTVIERGENRGKHTTWRCRCECGKICIVSSTHLMSGQKSCGCLGGKFKDLTGMTFGMLEVLRRVENKGRKTCYECRCKCGNIKIIRGEVLTRGDTKSCGCLRREKSTTHGLCYSKIHRTWLNIKARCYNPNATGYENYGARGIVMFEPWIHSFELFYEYVSKLPHFGEDGYSLDRENDNGNYEPGNLRWATQPQQARNTRRNVWVEYNGQKMCLKDAAEASGIDRRTLGRRFKSGKVGEELFKPTLKQGGDKNAPN